MHQQLLHWAKIIDRPAFTAEIVELTNKKKCFFCEVVLTKPPSGSSDTLHDHRTYDHVRCRSNGGGIKGNLVPACALCNVLRGNDEFVSFAIFAMWHIKPYRHDLEKIRQHLLFLMLKNRVQKKRYQTYLKHINNFIVKSIFAEVNADLPKRIADVAQG